MRNRVLNAETEVRVGKRDLVFDRIAAKQLYEVQMYVQHRLLDVGRKGALEGNVIASQQGRARGTDGPRELFPSPVMWLCSGAIAEAAQRWSELQIVCFCSTDGNVWLVPRVAIGWHLLGDLAEN